MKLKAQGKNTKPHLVGAGFIALDMVFGFDQSEPHYFAGGTTGNVLAAAAFLGWDSTALARLERDNAGVFVEQDLASFGVDVELLHMEPVCATPIVVQKNFKGRDGRLKHSFSWTCPHCGEYLPGYRALLSESADRVASSVQTPTVFFTDRVSRGTLNLAKGLKRRGAVIFFEPSTLGDAAQFVEMLQLADVLKYSDQRAKSFSDLLPEHTARVEIQTMGEEGLRFRLSTRAKAAAWTNLPAYLADVVDTSGAGDWTTAGMISALFRNGREGLRTLTKAKIRTALEFGQSLAAVNCGYEGARGMTYCLTPEVVMDRVRNISRTDFAEVQAERSVVDALEQTFSSLCPSCLHQAGSTANADSEVGSNLIQTI